MPTEMCMVGTKKWSPSWFCPSPPGNPGFCPSVKMWALPMPACEAISSESSQATLKTTKRRRQQKSRIKKVAITLETRQRLEDSPSCNILATTSTECFRSVQHKLLSKPATLKWESLLWEDACLYLYRHTRRYTTTPTYFCDFSYFFYLCYAMVFSKFVMIRFKAFLVIQILVSLKSEQKDPQFACVTVFPVKTITWKHPALSLTSTIFYFNFKKFNNLNKLSESVFLPFPTCYISVVA